MRGIRQTRFGKPDGNCLEACLASLFHFDIETIPHFVAEDDWVGAMNDWLAFNLGIEVVYTSDLEWVQGRDHLISGMSPRGPFGHTCVGRDGSILFDPHPDETGLEEPKDGGFRYGVFVISDASRRLAR